MTDLPNQRSVITQFHKTAGKRTYIWSLVALEPERGHDGKTYLAQHLYDVEYSRRFGYIWNMSGAGPFPLEVDGPYHVTGDMDRSAVVEKPCQLVDSHDRPPWRSKGTKAIRERNRTRLVKLPKQFSDRPDMLAWLQSHGIQSEAVYCVTCRDWFPGDNSCDWCSHVWWCDKTGWYSTPQERCKCKSREECRQ